MKKIVLIICLTSFLVNCSGGDDMEPNVQQVEMETVEEEMVEEPMADVPFKEGTFMSGAHPTSGTASVSSDKSILSFTNFKTDDGPKLLVYLSTDTNASEYVSLGDLQGIQGNFSYNIPANTDLGKYKLVNIWCVDFSVSFGTAELK